MEIRLHGRGGQGGVTCAKLLAAVYARLGKSVQAFGDYAGERSGAPVRAYVRVADEPITNRNKVYEPDHLLVLDPDLLGAETVSGLRAGGTLLVNTREPHQAFAARYPRFRVATVDATSIARTHRIGTRSLLIVNTVIAGAYAAVMKLPVDILEAAYRDLGFLGNFPAAREAFAAARVSPPAPEQKAEAVKSGGESQAAAAEPVVPLIDHLEGPAPGLKTGSWRTQHPQFLRNLAPCNAFCPAGNDVVGFIQSLAREGETTARRILSTSTPFPAVCGRVCPAPCMEACNRADYDGAVDIRGLERWIGDREPPPLPERPLRERRRRIAICGGGPAGLAAAFEVARAGHEPTIFEREPALGGLLRTGIPSYRLERDVLDREVDQVLSLGVKVETGRNLDREAVRSLIASFDAVILATGLQRLRGLDVRGSSLEGIEQGIRFLHSVNRCGGAHFTGHVIVLGGGNTAIDCARSALRSGASHASVVYRRTRAEMPAIAAEIEEAVEEGVSFLYQRQPVAFHGTTRVAAVEVADVVMGEPDATGRRAPVVTDRTSRIPCDKVLLALGQLPDLSLIPAGHVLSEGRVFRDGMPLRCFAAGDFATGEGTVTHAIGSGRTTAGIALLSLGETVTVFERPPRERAVPATDIRFDHFERRPPARESKATAEERVKTWRQVSQGLRDAAEAHRCFSCGNCTRCDTCLVYCPEGIISRARDGYEVDYAYCKGCGLCVAECPRKGLEVVYE
jgi:2-oxoacid:acceptor oxidoreductase gamma subunit (pyruvate/2-ketoisovalerate family)